MANAALAIFILTTGAVVYGWVYLLCEVTP